MGASIACGPIISSPVREVFARGGINYGKSSFPKTVFAGDTTAIGPSDSGAHPSYATEAYTHWLKEDLGLGVGPMGCEYHFGLGGEIYLSAILSSLFEPVIFHP
jgi:hypothetical protein